MARLNIQGRLGNNIIQLISSFLFCKKHSLNLYFDDSLYNHQYDSLYYNYRFSNLLDQEMIKLVRNKHENRFDKKIIINDDNFLKYYYEDDLDCEIIFDGYFYFFDIMEKERETVKKLFKVEYENFDEDNLFIHYRLGDINNSNFSLPLEYFIESIEKCNFSKGYISSDSLDDDKCKFLIKKYNLIPIVLEPFETIMFGKNFNSIILSESTFSFLIGYFSKSKNIILNKQPSKWGNDCLFKFDTFNF